MKDYKEQMNHTLHTRQSTKETNIKLMVKLACFTLCVKADGLSSGFLGGLVNCSTSVMLCCKTYP